MRILPTKVRALNPCNLKLRKPLVIKEAILRFLGRENTPPTQHRYSFSENHGIRPTRERKMFWVRYFSRFAAGTKSSKVARE